LYLGGDPAVTAIKLWPLELFHWTATRNPALSPVPWIWAYPLRKQLDVLPKPLGVQI